MKLLPLKLAPGVLKNGTPYQAKGRWIDANLVRWFEGRLGPIGGWVTLRTANDTDVDLVGFPRRAFAWRGNDGGAWLAVGTVGADSRLYAFSNGTLTDITPADLTDGSADGTTTGGDYGEGAYGLGVYGEGTGGLTLDDGDFWSLDNFGDFLVGCLTSDGRVLVWDRNVVNDAAPASGGPPTNNTGVCVTPERFLFVLGADGDVRKVQWPSQGTTGTWAPSAGNSAGSYNLNTSGRLLAGRGRTQDTLLWTDVDLHVATYIGGPFRYGFVRRGRGCGLIGPNAHAMLGDTAYWMSTRSFFQYDGTVVPLPCDVADYVFGDINLSQRVKINAVTNEQYGEVTWYYPSASQLGLENDRYVTYNTLERHWTVGVLPRGCGVDRGEFPYPVLLDPDGVAYEHERGSERDERIAYVESGPVELGDGDHLMALLKVIPDGASEGELFVTIYGSMYPNDPERSYGPYTLRSPTDVRLTERQVRIRLEEVPGVLLDGSFTLDGATLLGQLPFTDWRVGHLRLGVAPRGKR